MSKKKAKGVIFADVEDNCKVHGTNGFLEHAHIEQMLEGYDEEELEARAHGRFQHLTGLVFKKFTPRIHVIRPFAVSKRDYVVWHSLDPHPRVADAGIWVAVDRKGTYFVVDELFKVAGTREISMRIKKKNEDYRVEEMLIDPWAFNEDKHNDEEGNPSENTLASKFAEQGLDYTKATKTREASDRRIKDALDYEERAGELILAPELYIFDTCKRTIWELQHYQWDEWRGAEADRKTQKEKPMDKDDHMIEALGRILVQEPAWSPYVVQGAYAPRAGEESSFDPYARH